MDEPDVQEEPFEELRKVTKTQDDVIGNFDEADDNKNVQSIRIDYYLGPSRKRDYSNMQLLKDAIIVMNDGGVKYPLFKHLAGIIVKNMTAKSGIKKHKKLARDALFNEFFLIR